MTGEKIIQGNHVAPPPSATTEPTVTANPAEEPARIMVGSRGGYSWPKDIKDVELIDGYLAEK